MLFSYYALSLVSFVTNFSGFLLYWILLQLTVDFRSQIRCNYCLDEIFRLINCFLIFRPRSSWVEPTCIPNFIASWSTVRVDDMPCHAALKPSDDLTWSFVSHCPLYIIVYRGMRAYADEVSKPGSSAAARAVRFRASTSRNYYWSLVGTLNERPPPAISCSFCRCYVRSPIVNS